MKRLSIITGFLLLTISMVTVVPGRAGDLTDLGTGRSYIHPGRNQLPPTLGAQAGEEPYHNGATLLCSQCHIMHASQQHPHQDQSLPDPFGPFPQTYTPTSKLLKAFDPVALCLTCHDNVAGIPDVVGADVNGLTDRAGGFFDSPGTPNPRGHKLDYNLVTGPGFDLCMRCHFGGTFATAAVSCIDCHNQHGNMRPRNLQWASDPGGEPQFGLFINPAATGLARYEKANVAYGTSDDALNREVTNMCNDCHHVLTGAGYTNPDGSDIHSLHPSYDSERDAANYIGQGAPDGTSAPTHWEDGTGAGFQVTPRLRYVNAGGTDYATSITVDASTNGVFCLSCHRAHGGDRAFGLMWNPTSGINGEGCDQCHNTTAQ